MGMEIRDLSHSPKVVSGLAGHKRGATIGLGA
jgi:hypothetical protein